MVISFSGIDSAGKSTQIALFQKYCAERNVSSKVKWSKARATPAVEFIKRVIRRDKKMSHEDKLKNREQIYSNSKKKKLLLFASLFELCFYWGIYFRLLRRRYDVLILDRYLWDSCAEIKTDFQGIDFENWLVWRLLTRVAMKPDIAILLVVPLEASLERDIAKTDTTVANPAVIDSRARKTEKIETYFRLREEGKWTNVLDGLRTIDDIQHEIRTLVFPIE